MSRYSQYALNQLAVARQNNPNVSQRRLARNIFMLNDLDSQYGNASAVQSTVTLFRTLGNPSEIALQHLIRRIDRNVKVAASNNRPSRSRKTVGHGRRIKV